MERASYDPVHRFDNSPPAKAERLRKEARGTPPGVRRDELLRRALQIDTAFQVEEWLKPPGLQPPK